jgi:hypothetical protein
LDKITDPQEIFAWDCCYGILTQIRKINPDLFQDEMKSGRTPTFREFIQYLSINTDLQLDTHWRSQLSLLAFDKYDYCFSLETLKADWDNSELSGVDLIPRYDHTSGFGSIPKSDIESDFPENIFDLHGKDLFQICKSLNKKPNYGFFFKDISINNIFESRYLDYIIFYQENFLK